MHPSPRLLLDSLKRCPLCEAVNAEGVPVCFVCGWAGEFERDADDIKASFDALVAQCPDLAALKPIPVPPWKAWLRRISRQLRTRSV